MPVMGLQNWQQRPLQQPGAAFPAAQPTLAGQAAGDLNAARGAGFFDPQGSSLIQRATRRNALRTADNMRRRRAIMSRLMGLDPTQARGQAIDAERQASGDISGAINNAQYNQLAGAQDWARSLYSNRLGNEDLNARIADERRYQESHRPGIGAMLGGILGQGVGGFVSGYGGTLGERLAGGKKKAGG